MECEPSSPRRFGIDIDRVRSLFDEELARARHDLSGAWGREREDARTSALAWVARFAPEALSPRFRTDLERLVRELRARESFRTDLWVRCLPLDVALFCLTDDPKWLEVPRLNVDHWTSGLRPWELESLALVADRVAFDDPELQARTEHNIEINQMFCDWCVILLAVARGSAERKREKFRRWQARYAQSPVFSAGVLLDDLCRGSLVVNPFLSHFLRIQQYVSLRLAAVVE